MKHLPAAFVRFIGELAMHRAFRGSKHLRHFLLLRLALWRDGNPQNALPGYDSPPEDGPHGYPDGWSPNTIRHIVEKARVAKTARARRLAALA